MNDMPNPAGWTARMLSGAYRATDIAKASNAPDYAIEGLLPATGATMWFGAGSVGKTHLLLWMAAHLAAPRPDASPTWLGRRIHRRGHVLVLSAEDLREHLLGRLKGITAAMTDRSGRPVDAQAICDRIHLLPFLSLDRREFTEPSPSLFGGMPGWTPSQLLVSIEEVIQAWNAAHGADDQIIGVILDSAVTMAGFDLANAEATTRFLFHVNRRSHEQQVFWAIIGHTPKTVSLDPDDPQAGATARLRGAAMWSTSPRVIVEVRSATRDDDVRALRLLRPGIAVRDIVQFGVVKANLKNADCEEITLLRQADGAFEDVTATLGSARLETRASAAPAAVDRAVADVIREMTGGVRDAPFTREALARSITAKEGSVAAFARFDVNHEGRCARPGNLGGILRRLAQSGAISSGRKGPCKVLDLDKAFAIAIAA